MFLPVMYHKRQPAEGGERTGEKEREQVQAHQEV